MKRILCLLLLPMCFAGAAAAAAGQTSSKPLADKRTAAKKQINDGNWKDAFQSYQEILADPVHSGKDLAGDFAKSWQCLMLLGKNQEVDAHLEKAVAAHPADWRLLMTASLHLYQSAQHWGTIIDNKFQRSQYGAGKRVGCQERDRVRSLQLLESAMTALLAAGDKEPADDRAGFFTTFASIVASRESWELQVLTDLKSLPDYDETMPYGWRGRGPWHDGDSDRGAPVDEKGDPVFHKIPESWQTAATDGERWRWLITQRAKCGAIHSIRADTYFANWLMQEFDVHTMARWWRPMEDDNEEADRLNSLLAIHTLKEDETTARLATGVKKFTLPDEFNFLAIFKRLAAQKASPSDAWHACTALAGSFQNRRQLPHAAEIWRQALALNMNAESNRYAQSQLNQILKNWCRFDNSLIQTPGQGAKVGFVFRNGTKAHFTAKKIHFQRLVADVKKYLASNPENLDWQKINIQQVGYQILEDNRAKYIGEQVAQWDVELQPRQHHWDRRIDISTPLQTPGAYFVEAAIQEGNNAGIVVWITDTAIVKKPGVNETQYYVVDSITGAPVGKANMEFFGYRSEAIPDKQQRGRRTENILTRNFAEFTDAEGQFFATQKSVPRNYEWLVAATTPDGRFAHLGFGNVWYNRRSPDFYEQTKIHVITDRPVYRPGQQVKFKAWVRRANYDAPLDKSEFAGQKFHVEIHDGRGEKCLEKDVETDAYGGLAGELDLKEDATLGVYQFRIFRKQGEHFQQNGTFRVEEYKKPEYEVKIDAPADPVMLGEKVTAKASAKYYFGAPVVNARVKYKVQRSAHSARWYPSREWDWFYGPGYWWFCYDYSWYPGWRTWGCMAPVWWWWTRAQDPPELVLENEAPIGPDGTLNIEIDTTLAKELHPDEDHRYEITVEVTDESRRTIVGTGQVLVARQPFKVNLWTDRGHYEVGQPVEIGVRAMTLDQNGVKGEGTLKLMKLAYNDKGEPVEKEIKSEALQTDAEGSAKAKFSATEAGQFRLVASLTDAKGRKIEGGYVFVIRGQGFDGRDFRFNQLELVPDKAEYAPGQVVNLMINTERADSTVFLFVRSSQGVAAHPKILRLKGKSAAEAVQVEVGDMPNFFIEAFTVSGGKVHTAAREIAVPPAKRVLNLEVLADTANHKPRDKAKVKLKLTDLDGKPYSGSTVVTVYDKALEYISGGSNVPEIRTYFWKWRRHFYSKIENNLDDVFPGLTVPRGTEGMAALGVFGDMIQDLSDMTGEGYRLRGVGRNGMGSLRRRETLPMSDEPDYYSPPTPTDGLAPAPKTSTPYAEGTVAENLSVSGGSLGGGLKDGEQAPGRAAPQIMIRSDFADAVYWTAALNTNADGVAEIEVPLPDNLTTWKIKSWAMGHGTRVGEGEAEIITSKDLILRQQAPRFFVEKDEVVLSANVHNYLPATKEVKVSLEFDGQCLELLPGEQRERMVNLETQKEQRIDWRVKAVREGTAVVRMKAVTDADSDAMQMNYPVFVHGMLNTDSFSGAIRQDQQSGKIEFTVPNERRPEQTRLEIRYSPSIATAMVDAIPYMADYPYGCTEQTLNRFLPAVLAHKTLVDMGLDLRAIEKKRTNLNPQEIGEDKKRAEQWKNKIVRNNPLFNEAQYRRIVKQGLEKLTAMQNRDGGWGWFYGDREESYPHTTAVVVHGLLAGKASDLAIVPGVIENGLAWLKRHERSQVEEIKLYKKTDGNKGKAQADNLDAFVYMVLAEGDALNPEMRDFLYRDRNDLAVYAKACYGLALTLQKQTEKRDMLLKNIEQHLVQDPENQSARLDLRNGGFWWWWYGSEFEAEAFYLKMLVRIDPKSEKASGLVKYLVNNRKNGTYWNSTRDTAYVVEALNDYMKFTKESEPNVKVEILLDGKLQKEVTINRENLFSYDNALVLTGDAVGSGKHAVEVRKTGQSPVYFNAYLTNFTLEDRITKAGLEVKIDRKYYKLVERKDAKALVSGSRGQAVEQKVLQYDRQPIADGQVMKSGDLVEVELTVESKNDYEYLVFEDMKPAGFEAEEVRSGFVHEGLSAYREFRDERVCLFLRTLPLGKHSFSYRLKAEIPGKFSALPAKASAMYAPELRGNSDELKIGVQD